MVHHWRKSGNLSRIARYLCYRCPIHTFFPPLIGVDKFRFFFRQQVWPSSDSPRGEADGQSFVFPVCAEDANCVISCFEANNHHDSGIESTQVIKNTNELLLLISRIVSGVTITGAMSLNDQSHILAAHLTNTKPPTGSKTIEFFTPSGSCAYLSFLYVVITRADFDRGYDRIAKRTCWIPLVIYNIITYFGRCGGGGNRSAG